MPSGGRRMRTRPPRNDLSGREQDAGMVDGVVADSLSGTALRVSYGAREVLHGVEIAVRPGHIHALLGANGSGKSTLVKVLTGRLQPDSGQLTVGERTVSGIRSPAEAYAAGIRAVQQETPMIDRMTIAENIALRSGYPTGFGGRVRWRAVREHARALIHTVGLDLDPTAPAATVSAAERGLLAIGIALDTGPDGSHESPRVLILDEATASIPEEDAFAVLASVRRLADAGLAVLMVTHRMSEASRYADSMTVLYNGDVAYAGTAEMDPDKAIELIVAGGTGQAAAAKVAARPHLSPSTATAVTVDSLTTDILDGVQFTIKQGEVLGIVGGPRSGVEDVSRALAGLARGARGNVTIGGRSFGMPQGPRESIRRGISLVPRDRLRQGGIAGLSVFENVMLPNAHGLAYNTRSQRAMAEKVIEDFHVTPRNRHALFRELSGGNQQKVIVGKWLARDPRLLILDDPTVGVDPGARRTLFEVVAEVANKTGLAVLFLSSEPEELVRHCHRVLALQDGTIAEELAGERLTQVAVSRWASK